jgi:hypothetical protein
MPPGSSIEPCVIDICGQRTTGKRTGASQAGRHVACELAESEARRALTIAGTEPRLIDT